MLSSHKDLFIFKLIIFENIEKTHNFQKLVKKYLKLFFEPL